MFENVAYGVGNVVGADAIGGIDGTVTGMVAAGRVVGGYMNQMTAALNRDDEVADNENDQLGERSAEDVRRSRK